MPKRVPWREKAVKVDAVIADQVLEGLKSYDISHSQTMPCSLCSYAQHKMRYRLLEYNSVACCEASMIKCGWRGKTLKCLDTNMESVYVFGEHTSTASSPQKKKLTSTQKAFCREMVTHHIRPMRILHALSRKFDTPLEDLPALSTVQNFVNYYSRTYLENYDRVDHIKYWIHAHAFNGAEPLTGVYIWLGDGQ